jgi:hypothetical protein
MTLKEISTVFDTLLNATLKAGLFSDHASVKAAIIARDELEAKANGELLKVVKEKDLTIE